uniref:Cns1/TTC4 wheel domain-containing protein n=1 Tax=Sexangularia sp. CB-2014 TaxID=1486929 RepID=A0A7S1YEA8_9EUKA|mmetsp:Transcript_15872/g.49641  ORF Transcript_15872/g.49641 Transcript_15872/m.49641 type:complete len:422 (+) Transcript_15872:128-1393(+)
MEELGISIDAESGNIVLPPSGLTPELIDQAIARAPQLRDIGEAAKASLAAAASEDNADFDVEHWQDMSHVNIEDIPLFAEGDVAGEQLEALEALVAMPDDPIADAKEAKDRGNNAYSGGPKAFVPAADEYRRGILILERALRGTGDAFVDPADREEAPLLLAVLYANLCALNLRIGNYGSTVRDAKRALHWNPSNVKAAMRGARAALALQKVEVARTFVAAAGGPAEHKELAKLDKQCAKVEAARAAEERARERTLAVREAAAGVRDRQVRAALAAAGVKLGDALAESDHFRSAANVRLDEKTGELLFTIVFVYPQFSQVDTVQEARLGDPLAAHVERLLPLPWDQAGEYRMEAARLEAVGSTGTGRGDVRWFTVPGDATIGDILTQTTYLMPGLPIFYLTAVPSPFASEWDAKLREMEFG